MRQNFCEPLIAATNEPEPVKFVAARVQLDMGVVTSGELSNTNWEPEPPV